MKRLFELLRNLWLSFKRAWQEILTEDKEITSSTSKTQQPQKEMARPTDLGIASQDAPKYRRSKSLLTKPEYLLYQTLIQTNDNQFTIFVKVRMGDFVFLANEPQERKFHVNQVLCKHVDFLLCDIQSLEPLLVIELDDSSHKQYIQYERDEFKNNTFNSIGLPFLRIKVEQNYDVERIKNQIREKIK